MFAQPAFSFDRAASILTAPSTRRLVLATATAIGSASSALAVNYSFLNVASTSVSTSEFTGSNGTITVSHSFSAGGAGTLDNVNTAIYPSQFTTTFPGTGLVQGHLAQTVYNHTSVVEFNLLNYNISPSTIFGMWNTTDEVSSPPGGAYVYQMQLVIGNTQVNPTMLTVYGKQDNQTQVQGRHELDMNPATGEITPGATINGGIGTHTSATFWDNIPANTQKIIIYADLPPLNNIGDGVGYYFAEVVPEPSSMAMCGIALLSSGMMGRRRKAIV